MPQLGWVSFSVTSLSVEILPHHRLHRLLRPLRVLRRGFGVVRSSDLSRDLEVNQLAYRHAVIDPDGLLHRDLQRPCVADADIPFSRRGMDIDPQPPDAALSLQERDMPVRLGILDGHPQVEPVGEEYEAVVGDMKMIDLVVYLCIQDIAPVNRQMLCEVHIIGIRPEVFPVERGDDDRPFCHLGEY